MLQRIVWFSKICDQEMRHFARFWRSKFSKNIHIIQQLASISEAQIFSALKSVSLWSVVANGEICDFFASPAQNLIATILTHAQAFTISPNKRTNFARDQRTSIRQHRDQRHTTRFSPNTRTTKQPHF